MSRDTTRRRLLAGGAAAAVTALAGCSGLTPFVGKRVEETRQLALDGATALSVETDVGDVTVRGDDREDVRARIVKESSTADADVSKLRLRVERSDGTLRLRSEWTGGDVQFGSRPAMNLVLQVPRSLTVESARVDTGSATLRDLDADATVIADTGDVTVERVDGTVSAETETGSVTVRRPGTISSVRAETGDVDVDVPALSDDASVTTATGSATVSVAPDIDAELIALVDTGDVDVDGLTLDDVNRSEASVRGTLGDGGPELRVESDTGDVTVDALQ
jgi:DUF4097 and DUF4098 domain-containing protein YvlB